MLFVLLILVILGICGAVVFLLDSTFGELDFVSKSWVAKEVIKIIKQKKLENGNFYDLGSARGGFAIKIAKALPNIKVTGIDDNGFRVFTSKVRSVFLKNTIFIKEDIFSANISSANIIYLYLPHELMPVLQTKLQKELKPGTIVITNRINFPNWQPVQKIEEIYIYAKI